MQNKPFVAKLIKKNGRLIFKSKSDQEMFLKLAGQLREGAVVEQMTDFNRDDGTLGQLAAVHAMIKSIATEVGETALNVKLQIKKDCGLFDLEGNPKSFAICSRDELNDVKQTLIERGDFIGINLR